MALCVSAVTASSSLRLLPSAASVELCGTRLSFSSAVRGRSSHGVQVLRCVKSSETTGGKRIYAEQEVVELNRFLREEESDGYGAVNGGAKGDFGAEFVEEGGSGREDVEVEGIEDGAEEGEENDYWSTNGAGPSSETTVIYPQANQRVEDDLLKRIRYQNGREVFEERAYLVGIERKGGGPRSSFGIAESLEELAQLADTAGLTVVGTTYQK